MTKRTKEPAPKRRGKRVLCIGDTHCGHWGGLTPPEWHSGNEALRKVQSECWTWFARTVAALKPIDVLVFNGDAIDGKGPKSGGTEQITLDRNDQIRMALRVVGEVAATKVVMTYGTPYHTGADDDFEAILADQIPRATPSKSCLLDDHPAVEIEGVVFDIKHEVGGSSVPHGRATALLREVVWNALQSLDGREARANVLLRSHRHYHVYAGDGRSLVMTLPPLQLPNSKFGMRRCSGRVDYGIVHFDCFRGGYTWQAHLATPEAARRQTKKL